MEQNGFRVALQWVPFHVGLSGNEEADRLASEALRFSPSFQVPDDLRRHCRTVRQHFDTLAPHGQARGPPCYTKGLKREESTLLFRIRPAVHTWISSSFGTKVLSSLPCLRG